MIIDNTLFIAHPRQVQIDAYHLQSRSHEALQQFPSHDRSDGAGSDVHISPYHPPQPRRSSLGSGSNSGGSTTHGLVSHSRSGSGSHSGSPGMSRAHSGGMSHPHAYSHHVPMQFGMGTATSSLVPPPLQPRSRTRYDSPRLPYDNTRVGGTDYRTPYENIQVGTQRTPPVRRATNYERQEFPRDASYHSNISHGNVLSGRSETSTSRLTGENIQSCNSQHVWVLSSKC